MNEDLVTRVRILNVPIDIVKKEHLHDLLCRLAEDGNINQIILLDFPGFMRARRKKGEWKEAVYSASLVLPISYRLINAARFLKIQKPVHYKSFDFIISLLGSLEDRRKSAYLLGSSKKKIQKSFSNLKNSFPGLRFVGRHQGKWDTNREDDIIIAIKKASPTLLLAGKNIKGRDLWLYRIQKDLNPAILLWNKNCYEIMGGRKRKPSETKISRLIRNTLKTVLVPWHWGRILRQIWFWLLLLWEKIRS